jgi:PAS domain S-box-containing protein
MSTISAQQINIIISIVACITSLFIARSAWQRRRTAGANFFFGVVVAVVWVTFWYIFEAASGFDVDAYLTFTKLEYIGLMYIPVFWLLFSMTYGSKVPRISHRGQLILLLAPLITISLAWTNEWHGLIWRVPLLIDRNGIPTFEPVYGGWFWVSAIYNYTIFLIGSIQFFRQITGTWQVYRAQAMLLLVSTGLPWIGNLLQIFDSLNPFPGIYINAFFLSTSMLGLTVGLFRLRLLDIAPLARETILENLPVGFVVVDEQARIIASNSYIQPFTQSTSKEIFGKKLQDIFPSLSTPAGMETIEGQHEFHGQYADVKVTPVLDGNGNWRGHLFILNNVTARVQAQQALERSEKRQRALLEAQPDMIFRLRSDGTYLDYHGGSAAVSSLPSEFYVGKTINELWSPESAARDMKYIQQVLETRTMAAYEFSTTSVVDGQEHDYEARVMAAGSDEVVAIVRRIDERKQAERRALALALERERVSMISQFIQDTSHEFRTPLSVIRVSLHLLKRAETPEKRENRAARIEEQINRLTRLVDMLVKMSALDGDVQFRFRPTNINKVIELMIPVLDDIHKPQGITIVYDLKPDLPLVELDQEQFMQVVHELFANASQHTSSSGTITLRTSSNDEYVLVEVEDSGSGIPAEALAHLFDRFYRLDHAHSTPGFGLGLAIVKRIVELHGGNVRVESKVGEGSRFIIRLPYNPNATPENTLPNPPE